MIPTTKKGIGMGYVSTAALAADGKQLCQKGSEIYISIREKLNKALVV